MAEYAWVMKQWQRMCGSMQGGIAKCDNCPLLKVICQYKPDEKADFDEAEKIIADWAAENPEYPTWWEWLENMGIVSKPKSDVCSKIFDTTRMYDSIPADIAQKLIELVPVVHGDCGATNEADARKKFGIEPKEVG